MAEKDITEKILLSYEDVFADIVNALLFKGERIIQMEVLVDQAPRAAYKADGKVREMERDVAKRWLKKDIRIACIGFENESKADSDMVLRVYGYDGAEYRTQLLKENLSNPRYPVVTLVLYFGYKKHWDAPIWLHEAVLQLLSVMTKDSRFEDVLNPEDDNERGVNNMCDVLDRVEARGEKKGEKKGEKNGERKLAELITRMFSAGRGSEVEKVASDEQYRAKLFKEFQIL